MTRHMPLRQRLFLILRYASVKDKTAALAFSWLMTLMVLINVVAVILESVPEIDHKYQQAFAWFDAFSILFFSVEYLLRVWTAAENHRSGLETATRRRLHYMLGFHGVIDLIAILPFFLQSLLPGLLAASIGLSLVSAVQAAPFQQSASLQGVTFQVKATGEGSLQQLVVNKNAAGQPWLAGAHFGPLDAYALTLSRWGTIAGITPEEHPMLWAFVEQVAAEPAVARVIERERLQLNMAKPA